MELVAKEKNYGQLNYRYPDTPENRELLEWMEIGGYTKYRAVFAALRLLRVVPAEVREMLIRGDEKGAQDWMRNAVQEVTLAKAMQIVEQTLPSQQESRRDARRKASGGTDRSA